MWKVNMPFLWPKVRSLLGHGPLMCLSLQLACIDPTHPCDDKEDSTWLLLEDNYVIFHVDHLQRERLFPRLRSGYRRQALVMR